MYRELYYWAYSIYSKKKRFKGEEKFKSYLVVCALQGFKLIMIGGIINHYYPFFNYLFFNPKEGKLSIQNWILPAIFMLPILIYNYFNLYKKNDEIIQHFNGKDMSQFRKDWGILFFWLYVIFTAGFILVIGFFLNKTH